jgi:hypothetical protein
MSNAELLALSRRLRGKSALLLDVDWSFAQDLIMASFALATLGHKVEEMVGAIDNVDASPVAGIGVEHLTLQPVLVRNDSILHSHPPA